MKKHISVLGMLVFTSFALSVLFPIGLTACDHIGNDRNENGTSKQMETADLHSDKEYTPEELETILNPSFSSSPFFNVVEGEDPLSVDVMRDAVHDLPPPPPETYPDLHTVPLTATLYKGDEVISIDLNDSRLIRMMNLYNNSVYYRQYAYTQGLLNINYLEEVLNEEFRLVLTFRTKNNDSIRYDTNIQAYDTMIITNQGFVLIGHNLPGYEGQEDKYPFQAIEHTPLFNHYCWLDLFGF